MAGILFLLEFPQGSLANVGGLQSLMPVTSFVYRYGRKYSISHGTQRASKQRENAALLPP